MAYIGKVFTKIALNSARRKEDANHFKLAKYTSTTAEGRSDAGIVHLLSEVKDIKDFTDKIIIIREMLSFDREAEDQIQKCYELLQQEEITFQKIMDMLDFCCQKKNDKKYRNDIKRLADMFTYFFCIDNRLSSVRMLVDRMKTLVDTLTIDVKPLPVRFFCCNGNYRFLPLNCIIEIMNSSEIVNNLLCKESDIYDKAEDKSAPCRFGLKHISNENGYQFVVYQENLTRYPVSLESLHGDVSKRQFVQKNKIKRLIGEQIKLLQGRNYQNLSSMRYSITQEPDTSKFTICISCEVHLREKKDFFWDGFSLIQQCGDEFRLYADIWNTSVFPFFDGLNDCQPNQLGINLPLTIDSQCKSNRQFLQTQDMAENAE